MVPLAAVRDTMLLFVGYSFAIPKSETFGMNFSSRRIL
uniref:Uncharacterized protein n=1 Tax=Rhizophora mucronata TaxID=61149 RepID=A0A2P2QBH5_RHIMU